MSRLLRFIRIPLLSAVLALWTVAAHCQESERAIAVARTDCRLVVAHVAAPDVAYQPGVDVHGRPVVPADVDGAAIVLPEVVPIIISSDLRDRFGLDPDSPLFNADVEIGVVELVLASGGLFFNGAPLGDNDERALAALCREAIDGH
jgi:hypothetical protein